MEINIKAFDKLVEVVSQGIGTVSKSFFIRKNADAKAHEMLTIANAKSQAQKLLGDGVSIGYIDGQIAIVDKEPLENHGLQLPSRTEERKQFQEAQQQHNLEEIVGIATEEVLQNAEEVSDEPVEQDWINRFFEDAKFISDEKMQMLWGRILADEVKNPDSFSLRTLSILRNMLKAEAEVFMEIANLAIESSGRTFMLYPNGGSYLKDVFNVSYENLLLMDELGLLLLRDIKHTVNLQNEPPSAHFVLNTHLIVAEYSNDTLEINFPVVAFTRAGGELLQLVSRQYPEDYLVLLMKLLKREGVIFSRGDIINKISQDGFQEYAVTNIEKIYLKNK